MPDLQSGGCGFESQPGLLRTKVYSAFHPSAVGKWVPAAAGKAKAGMAHSDCRWTCGCADKTVKSLENTCHTWALLRWWFTTKRRYIKCMHLYLYRAPLSVRIDSIVPKGFYWNQSLTGWVHIFRFRRIWPPNDPLQFEEIASQTMTGEDLQIKSMPT